MKRRTNLLHPLSWYQEQYGLPEQTIVNAYKRGWPLDDPTELLERLIHAPGPKSKGLQPFINFVNSQSGPSTVQRGSSRIAPTPKAESSVKKAARAQDDERATILIEVTVGDTIYWRLIDAAEADKILRLTDEPWLNKPANE